MDWNWRQTWKIAIPTLTQYERLIELITSLIQDDDKSQERLPILVLDNGGNLPNSPSGLHLKRLQDEYPIQIIESTFNHGVAGSWNYFAANHGRCIISNDDVRFNSDCIRGMLQAASKNPDRIIIENDDHYGGFSLFCLNQPDQWLALGGFDELFNPAYFEDDDARWRLRLHGNPSMQISLANWRHTQTSTMNHATGSERKLYGTIFRRNMAYYVAKWGGLPGQERYQSPFNHKQTIISPAINHSNL